MTKWGKWGLVFTCVRKCLFGLAGKFLLEARTVWRPRAPSLHLPFILAASCSYPETLRTKFNSRRTIWTLSGLQEEQNTATEEEIRKLWSGSEVLLFSLHFGGVVSLTWASEDKIQLNKVDFNTFWPSGGTEHRHGKGNLDNVKWLWSVRLFPVF